MKLYIKIDEDWFITESSLQPYDKAEKAKTIDVTDAQYEKIRKQYDTKVVDGEIDSQTKWDNAKIIEQRQIDAEKREADRKAAELAALQETPTPTE